MSTSNQPSNDKLFVARALEACIHIGLVGISDAFFKPLLMGRGVDVPMLVIFIGAIGGFIASGIIGLFVGAIVFTAGYKLFLRWLNEDTQPEPEPSKSE